MKAKAFRTIGHTLGGTHWQADLARIVGCSRSQITRYLNATRTINAFMATQIETAILERIEALVKLLLTTGLPSAANPETKAAIDGILEKLATLKSG